MKGVRRLLRGGVALLAVLTVAPAAAAEAQEPSLHCRLYLAVEEEPQLGDLPVLITSARRGRVEVVVPSLAWMESQPGGFPKNLSALGGKEKLLRSVLKSQPGVSSVGIERDGLLEFADFDARKAEALEKLCPARLDAWTEPAGAVIFVDGRPKGELPAEVEVASGERRLEIELEGYRAHRETVLLQPGERREIRIELEPLAALDIATAPAGAAALVNGADVAMTPARAYVDRGIHTVRLLAPGYRPLDVEIDAMPGETYPVEAALEPRGEGGCYAWEIDGTVKERFKDFRKELVGEVVDVVLPLPKVLSSVMENELATTHVVDGRRILFEARMGDDYVDHPGKLLWRELGGLSFGEVGTEIIETPTGPATITEVKKKNSTLVVEIRHDDGTQNAVYLDYTAGIDGVTLDDIELALCRVFAPPHSGTLAAGS